MKEDVVRRLIPPHIVNEKYTCVRYEAAIAQTLYVYMPQAIRYRSSNVG